MIKEGESSFVEFEHFVQSGSFISERVRFVQFFLQKVKQAIT